MASASTPIFSEYTFRSPRPGYFLGDSRTPDNEPNPVATFTLKDHEPASRAPGLGDLDKLPLELLHDIVARTDVRTAVIFRSVSQSSRDVVDSLRCFRRVAAFPRLLGAAYYTRAAHRIDILAKSVENTQCASCDHFGDLFCLLAGERVCYVCWREMYSSVSAAHLRPPCAASSEDAVDPGLARRVLLPRGYYGETGQLEIAQPIYLYMHGPSDVRVGFATRYLGSGPPRDLTGNPPLGYGYATIIRAPYWDEKTQRFEEGFHCQACAWRGQEYDRLAVLEFVLRRKYHIWDIPWRRYTRDGMRAHLEEFGGISAVTSMAQLCELFQGAFDQTRFELQHIRPPQFVHMEPSRGARAIAKELVRIAPVLRKCRTGEVQLEQGQLFVARWIMVPSRHYRSQLCSCGGVPCGTWRTTCPCQADRGMAPCRDESCSVHYGDD